MKRKNIFIVAAFILAIGSAFTTLPARSNKLVSGTGYIKTCTPSILCDGLPGFACTTTSHVQLYDAACSVALTRSTPNP